LTYVKKDGYVRTPSNNGGRRAENYLNRKSGRQDAAHKQRLPDAV
jgi:hypothetical protein